MGLYLTLVIRSSFFVLSGVNAELDEEEEEDDDEEEDDEDEYDNGGVLQLNNDLPH